MEDLVMTPAFWKDRQVLLTGHTGFKGSWLALWLNELNARVTGFALPPPEESLFNVARVVTALEHRTGDIRDFAAVRAAVRATEPEIIFHLAAQSLVRVSYEDPLTTFATNVLGTAHVLQAAAEIQSAKAIVVVTSDKCYGNRDGDRGFCENDPMGGDDPYSASKGCAELSTHAWRKSFFAGRTVASARAGNVIGGGDWAADRLVPDLIRAFIAGRPGAVRSPLAVRPWQYILEPLCGYLILAERLWEGDPVAEGWNFGPDESAVVPVADIANGLVKLWEKGARWEPRPAPDSPKESLWLQLDSTKARTRLNWRSTVTLDRALEATVAWYKHYSVQDEMERFSRHQIAAYQRGLELVAVPANVAK